MVSLEQTHRVSDGVLTMDVTLEASAVMAAEWLSGSSYLGLGKALEQSMVSNSDVSKLQLTS